jgi:hypothetical protein
VARKYKVVIITSDGRDEQDEVFETEEAAEEFGLQWCSDMAQGAEYLHEHNPGDHPDEDGGECEWEVIEVDA